MKTHLFKLQRVDGTRSIKDLLDYIHLKDLGDRNRNINGHENRIEDLLFLTNDGVDCALVNFVKLRMDHGPGRGSLDEPTESFRLKKSEGFAEETAALFDLTYNALIVEYNHHGARASALEDYLTRIIPTMDDRFEFLPRLDDRVMQKLGRMQTLSKMEVKVAPRKLTDGDKHKLLSISQALNFAEAADAPSVTITLGGLPGMGAILNDKAWAVLNALTDRVAEDDALADERDRAVKTLKVVGKERADSAPELLDLIKGRVYGEHELIAGADRRYSRDDRWEALKKDHLRWRKLIR